MNALIVEDEDLAAERLQELIHVCDPDIQVMAILESIEETTSYLNKDHDHLDLIFMDIELADGKSFEIFRKTSCDIPVIFTTAYDQYAIDAFKVNSIDYLLKPIKKEELEAAINKYKKRENQSSGIITNKVLNQLLDQQKFKKRFPVHFGNKIQFVECEDIACFHAEGKICHLIRKTDGRKYLLDHTLEELTESLLNPANFFRINRQFIVNLKAIKELKVLNSNQIEVLLTVAIDASLIVSRSKTKDFKIWIND